MDVADTIPVPVTEAGIGTVRVPIPDDDPLFADEALVASASVVSDFEDAYLTELTAAVDRSLKSLRQMVVSRLRARATIAEPVAASAGSAFANPWHDELGRFAPKGTGSYKATGAKYERIVGDFAETGTVAEPPDVDVEVTDTDRGRRYTATHPLGGTVVMYDDGKVVPDDDRAEAILAAAMAAKIAGNFPYDLNINIQNRANKTAKGWVNLAYPDNVYLHANYVAEHGTWETAAKEKALTVANEMASEPMIDPRSWTAMHETGHSIHGYNYKLKSQSANPDDQRIGAAYDTAAKDLYATHQASPLVSTYAKKNHKEMFSETFAEWVNTNGSTNNPIVQQYAETFGWRLQDGSEPYGSGQFDREEEALAAAGPAPDDDDRTVMVEYTDPATGLASGAALTEAEFEVWINGDGLPPDQFTMQFANPWHDEVGRFAPKGTGRKAAIETWGTDRKVTIEKWAEGEGYKSVRGHKHSVTTSNGDVITLYDQSNVLSQTEGGEQAISDLLNGAADAHDLSPGMPAPKLVAQNVDSLITTMTDLTGQSRQSWQKLNHVSAFVSKHAPGTIFVNPNRVHAEPRLPDDDMPAMLVVGPARWKAMHEYGHLRMQEGLDPLETINDLFGWTSGGRRSGGMSKYGNRTPLEAHAEAFAEWAARGGYIPRGPNNNFITDTDYVVTVYANELGWTDDLEQVGQPQQIAAAGAPSEEMPVIIGDTPEGPFYIYADGRVEEHLTDDDEVFLASVEFANPWHDEIGRFAPKGTGVKRLGPATLNDRPTAYDEVDLEDTDAVEASLKLWAQEMTEKLREELPRGIDGDEITVLFDKAKHYKDGESAYGFEIVSGGERIGEMSRHLVPSLESSVGFEGYAAQLHLINSVHGRGIGTVLQEGFEDWAASQGIEAMRVYAVDVGRYAWMRAGYDWADTDSFRTIANMIGGPAGDAFRKAAQEGVVTVDVPTPYEVSQMLSRNDIFYGWEEFPSWEGIKPLRTRELAEALAATATIPREERLAKVRDAWAIWSRQYPAAAEGYIVDPEAETAWAALMGEDQGLVAAGPFNLPDFNVMTAEEWAAAFSVEAADIVGDVVVDAATGQALRPGLNVSDKVITDLIDRHVGRLQDLGPLVQTSIRDALALAVREQLSLDDVIREIQATGPLGETAARAIARTELTAATNGGMLTGWKRDGFPFKQWVSLHDDRVRNEHLEADKQVVPTEQEFEVGGWPAQYPGDPRLPVHLRINCRCYMDRIGEDGQTLNTRLVDSTRAQLYRLAQELNIPGRSKMRKDDLFQAIDRYRNGFGYTSLEEMNRAQLLIRARLAGIVGRHRMTKPELMIRLRDLAAGRDRDRWLIDAGHGTREQLAAVHTQLAADIAALGQPGIVAAGPPPNAEKIDTIRRQVARRYAADTGTAMCVGCGARLHWSNSTRWEQMTMLRLNSNLAWSSKNAMPVCLACAPKLAGMTTEKIAATFSTDQSWSAIADSFVPGWGSIIATFSSSVQNVE